MVKRANGVKGRRKGLNKHQRAAFREGEERIGREEIRALLQLSESKDPADRLQAASLLCPCHVRKRIEEVWAALYRMLKDDDPALDEIIERTLECDSDKQVLGFARQFFQGREQRKQIEFAAAAISDYAERGKCDFCGESNARVKKDFTTEFEGPFALVCEPCDQVA
jgi:hypothetical protein